ncbi:MAG: acyl-CoA thioesterase II [Halioglobus sp.]|nr:acyl-CoA thioesterase II [Halioglobus sp.]MCB1707314.1 acyl-CoA thioesterase II [Halioglobus sp.]MCP5122728.1 acyl-CoA thioesterase II [Pseudomonadales bacterium]MCP5194041.1 acyl-CoA thioesterase II [Pseudomonadales bacterium]
MPTNLEKLLQYLEVDAIDKYLFIGKSPKRPARIFGGQVLAQSLNAAIRTVPHDRMAHSLHGYFLRPGDPLKQIVYEVDPIRDGRSFTTRRVVAKQDGCAIFNTAVSFQIPEEGLSHQSTMPDVPPPEALESEQKELAKLAKQYPDRIQTWNFGPIERRRVLARDRINPQPQEPVQHIWFKVRGDVGADPRRHQTLLAYISDFGLLGTALYPHPYAPHSRRIQEASLDHALWFHRPFRVDDYLLYSLDSPNSAAGRGFSRGSFYSRDGVLVASSAQEALLRLRTD